MYSETRRSILQGAAVAALALCLGASVFAGNKPPRVAPLDRATSLAVFERIKQLSGKWQAKSTKGWEQTQEYRVISNGSAVTSESTPGRNPGAVETAPTEPMLTVFHMDGDRLLLTHYCEAKNQPRMVATAIEDGGRTVHFSFLDATNLASPAAGHMHSAVITFIDETHFSERWSWYQDGQEAWMEQVVNERVNP